MLNPGIGGIRVLNGPVLRRTRTGDGLLARLEPDVLGQAGMEDVIVLIGTNDLGVPVPPVGADELIAGLEALVDRLHEAT